MFDRSKPADEASASSAQGIERRGIEGSLRQESSSSVLGPERAGPGISSVQNRQGYCNCCHVHYSNLEQHVFSSQHRHFTMYCRNRIGTTSLMERFLQDVLQHHPHRYHDNRPTYDDMPSPISPMAPRNVCLLPEEVEKEVVRNRREMSGTDGESIVKSCSPTPCRSQKGMKEISVLETFIQKLKRGQEHILEISQQTVDICNNGKKHTLTDGAQIANSSHNGQFTAVSPVPHHLPVIPLCHSSPVSPVIAKNIRYSATSNLIPSSSCDHLEKNIWHKDGLLNTNPNSVLASVNPRTTSFSHQCPTCSLGNSLYITSGQSFFKRDGLRSQDETLVSDFCLRDLVGTSSSLSFGTSPQLTRCEDIKMSRGDETSVDEIIEEVILKYCYGAPPNELPCKDEENNSYLNISSLLDHSSLEGSEISFACEAPVCSIAGLPKANIKDLEFLKDVQVNLEDRDYGTQLSSVLKGDSAEQVEAAKQDIIDHNEEPVLPALPHVPPSFVGKTWSQIMYEDDIKVEALVRDFREGRFHCYFDSESSANCTGKRMRKKKKDERKSDIVTGKGTETASVKALPEFNDALSGGSDFDTLLATDTLCNPQTLKMPRKRTWRLASRCQVVKVSHGTQTSLVNYPVVKRKIIRKEPDPPDQNTNCVWSDNERVSNMKTRLCALKLPEGYTKIMSPLQPKTVVYVLSCPENKQYKGKPIDVPKMRRNHNSTDSKNSIRYRYKQCSLKYYDPLTNRILKTPPKSTVREKVKKPSHVRQLFRSLSLDANTKKLFDAQRECTPSKSFNWSAYYSSSSAAFLSDPLKGNDMNSSQRTDGSSISTERSDFPVFVHSEMSYKHSVISPFNSHESQMEGDRLTPFNSRVAKTPLKSIRSEQLERETPKTMWKRKEGTSREPGFSKKASGPMSVKCGFVRTASKVAPGKQASRTKKQKKDWIRRNLSSFASKSSSVFSIHGHQTRKPTLGKHLTKEKLDAKKLKVRRKPKRKFLNSTVIPEMTVKRQKVTAGSFPKKPELTSSKVKSWEISGDKFPQYCETAL
ncbi:DBF4-type zinc finger-containing protein 2 [Emydura macquarii macquarii]|uniref:DBF4-type zinc finger-containing protein 2 n=1 Tax=Emydura macquarii macquarii TaxID=1129001 RepID=UPI00352B00F8